MSKKTSALQATDNKYYAITKEGNAFNVTFAAKFIQSARSAATDLDNLIADKTPIAINLWMAYKHVVTPPNVSMKDIPATGRASLTALQFFHAIDETIPTKYPKIPPANHVCNKECTPATCRKQLNSHAIFNRLTYLTLKIGRTAAGDNPKPPSKKDKEEKAQTEQAVFVRWAKKANMSSEVLYDLIAKVLKMKTKDGTELTKKGKSWYDTVLGKTVIDSE